ncbi:hypothetical protein HS048_22330 [Planomonospora sp. ID91781]|uniref:hypothetical protein n=1 Tax=Planomonospora sp. ID91781 TaxID=2738135 RepID=UPI0018C39864|nr:hypothetical protein [Planomonospora sp. ID91781]MBG0823472.1 hypothetical protein [Planomonospora sp. ID91781]
MRLRAAGRVVSAGARGRPSAFGVLAALAGVFLLCLAVPGVGPSLRAARADGVPGLFTARELTCVRHPGHESCTWTGEFRSGDGAVRRQGVALYGSDRESLRPGQETAAVDVGRPHRVYGPGGSREWVFTALLLAAGLGLVGHPFLRIRRARRPAAPDAPDVPGVPAAPARRA